MNVLKVTFKDSPNSSCIVYGAMTSYAPVLGILKSENCGGVFYCYLDGKDSLNRTTETSKGFYKLYEPNNYALNISEGFVMVDNNPTIQHTDIVDSESIKIEHNHPKVMMMRSGLLTAPVEDNPNGEKTSIPTSIRSTKDVLSEQTFTKMLNKAHKENNLVSNGSDYEELKLNMVSKFNRFRLEFADNRLSKAFPRVFFTRPDLNLFDANEGSLTGTRGAYAPPALTSNLANDTSFLQLYNTDPLLIASLTKLFTNNHDFNPFLSNMASSFDVSDEKLETFEHGKTFTGWKIKLGKHSIGSQTAGSFSISYDETNRAEIYKIHKAWIDYISKVYRGATNSKERYIRERRLDYACSVYYFLCAEDGETVLYWCKYVGVFPTSAPTSEFSWSKNSIIQTPDNSIEYEYAWKEDMEPASLTDFNSNSHISMNLMNSIPRSYIYEPNKVGTGVTFKTKPFVTVERDSTNRYVVRLRYTKD